MFRSRSRAILGKLWQYQQSHVASCSGLDTLPLRSGRQLFTAVSSFQPFTACSFQPQLGYSMTWAARALTTEAESKAVKEGQKPTTQPDGSKQEGSFDSLELTEEKMHAITDKIPQKPVGVVEGTSYSIIILAAFGMLAFLLYQFVSNFILEPVAMQCFNHALEKLKSDPRITVRLGSSADIRAWGSNSQSRVGRQQIPHQVYKDQNGVEHVRIQFYMRGPGGTALVNADMYKDADKQWQYMYLLADVQGQSSSQTSRLHIISPK